MKKTEKTKEQNRNNTFERFIDLQINNKDVFFEYYFLLEKIQENLPSFNFINPCRLKIDDQLIIFKKNKIILKKNN
jgi:hypothetical protein